MKRSIILSVILLTAGCASQEANKSVDENLKRETGIFNQGEIADKTHEIIMNHPSLNEKQRAEMQDLFAEVYRKNILIRSEIGKLKGVLFKTLFNPNRKEAEMNVIKKRLLVANQRKMDTMLDALDKASKIIAKDKTKEELERLWRDFDSIHISVL